MFLAAIVLLIFFFFIIGQIFAIDYEFLALACSDSRRFRLINISALFKSGVVASLATTFLCHDIESIAVRLSPQAFAHS